MNDEVLGDLKMQIRDTRDRYNALVSTIRDMVEGAFKKRDEQVSYLYNLGFTVEEIADILNLSTINVYSRLKRLGKVKFS